MLTGRCKIEFNNWFEDFKEDALKKAKPYFFIPYYENFIAMPFSMQYGVYVDFFDNVGIIVDVQPVLDYNDKCYTKIYSVISNVTELNHEYNEIDGKSEYNREPSDHKTRQEAREQAIKKANDIYNSK